MKRYYMLALLMVMTMFGFSAEQEQIVMTTGERDEISICIAGSGTIVIDWGDGLAKETHSLSAHDDKEKDFSESTFTPSVYHYKFSYSDVKPRKITITGGKVTHLKAAFVSLETLDISKSTELEQLFCGINQLMSLDLSNNTKLTHLAVNAARLKVLDISSNPNLIYVNCVGNRLKSLDLSNNSKVQELLLFNNSLESLDVSKCVQLKELTIASNYFSTNSLNQLFETLHSHSTQGERHIVVVSNLGTSDCDENIAIKKGWTVTKEW